MGLDELEEEIASDYSVRIAELGEETKGKCAEIISSAESDAEKALDQTRSEAAEEVKLLERRELAAARVEAKRIVSEAREKVVENILKGVRQGLAEFADSPEYRKMLPKYVKKAASEIGADVVVRVRKKDRDLVGQHELSKEDLDCVGGVIFKSKDSTVAVDATIDTLFKDSKPQLREAIYRRLFT